MAGASILRNLSDADLDAVHHMIRRDAMTDLAIARWAEKNLREAIGEDFQGLGNDQAAIMVIARYRSSEPYQTWLKRWENQDVELKKAMELQKARFEIVSALVGDADEGGMERLSKGLQARLLTLAAEASDEELREASGKSGWIKNVIGAVQAQQKVEQRRAGMSVKAAIEDAVSDSDEQTKERFKAVVATVDKVMGLA
jgi:hypothetical protein